LVAGSANAHEVFFNGIDPHRTLACRCPSLALAMTASYQFTSVIDSAFALDGGSNFIALVDDAGRSQAFKINRRIDARNTADFNCVTRRDDLPDVVDEEALLEGLRRLLATTAMSSPHLDRLRSFVDHLSERFPSA
jgi:hypothetical protein